MKIAPRSSGRSAGPCRAATVGRRVLVCNGRFESKGITGGEMGKGRKRPVPIYKMAKPRSGMGGIPGEMETGLVTAALRRKQSF
jgi:hypothetical protein